MKQKMMHEGNTLRQLRAGLITCSEAIQRHFGFIDAMVAYGVIEQDRAREEKEMFVERLLEQEGN